MFSPEMMANAQKMMQNMSPDQFAQMSQMAANMDPSVLQNMAGSMGQNIDAAEAQKQMKNMTPDQMKQGFQEAQKTMGSRNQYMLNGATTLKNEGNEFIKEGKYTEAKAKYELAKTNLAADMSTDAQTIKKACTLNLALCKLKLADYHGTISDCEEILKDDPQSTKALYRRGQAYVELGELQHGCVDIRKANEISPQDTTKKELERVRQVMKEKGIEEVDEVSEPPKVCAPAEKSTTVKSSNSAVSSSSAKTGVPTSFAPPGSSALGSGGGGSSSSSAPGTHSDAMREASDKLAKDPDMMKNAMDAMKNMDPAQMESMLSAMPNEALPAGATPEMMKQQLSMMRENPQMMEQAMSMMKNMPEDDRKKYLEQQKNKFAGGAGAGNQAEAMKQVMENPDMMKSTMDMLNTMPDETLEKMCGGDKSQVDQMRKVSEEMSKNPELAKQMTDMMSKMPPDQMAKMMEMQQGMRNRGGAGEGGGAGDPGQMQDAMKDMMSNPEMMKMAEEMTKNITPEQMASMAKAQGIELDEGKAKVMLKFIPWVVKFVRLLGQLKAWFSNIFMHKGRLVLVFVIVIVAIVQRWLM